jgi:chemotaxis protein MotB
MAGKKSSGDSEPPNPLGWMVTFSDLITLLLTFFVLLISMSSMDVKAVQQSFGQVFSGGSGPMNFSSSGHMEDLVRFLDKMQEVPAQMLIQEDELKTMIFESDDVEFQELMALLDRDISVKRDERGLVIQLADHILFHEGGSVLKLEFLPVLGRLANVLRLTRNPVSIEGHTDDSVLEGGDSVYAWELSLQRAIAVLRYFTEEESLMPESFRVGGYGPSKPVMPNDSPTNRAKNRRIEIIIYREQLG